jgi:hypothetical protein
MAASCDPEETVVLRYYVKNNTNDTIQMAFSYPLNTNTYIQSKKLLLVNKDSIILINMGSASEDNNVNLFEGLFNWNVVDDTLSIFDKDSVLIKQWIRFFPTNETGKQFFRERDWSYRTYQNNGEKYIYHEWTFEITDNDLQ